MSSAGLVNLIAACTKLRTLRVKCIDRVDDRVMEGKCPPPPPPPSTLLKLFLSPLAAIAKNLPEIRVLNVAGCNEITDDGLEIVLRKCPELIRLSLVGLTNLTDKSIPNLLKSDKLQEIDLANTPRITSGAKVSVKHLDVSMQSVKKLNW